MRHTFLKTVGQYIDLDYLESTVSPRVVLKKSKSAKRKAWKAVKSFFHPMNLCSLMLYSALMCSPWLGIASVSPNISYTAQNSLIERELSLKEKVVLSALKNDIEPEIALTIVKKESAMNDLSTTSKRVVIKGDQKILKNGYGMCTNRKSPLYGKPANARGIAQITECWHPNISDDEAYDVDFSIEFLVSHLAKGKCGLWSTCPL